MIYKKKQIFPFALLLLSLPVLGGSFIGSKNCSSCHQKQVQLWQESDHAKSMDYAAEGSVLGDFSGVSVVNHGVKTTFSTRIINNKKEYIVETIDQSSQEKHFKVKYTFGFYPLQQYLIELDDGHVQALNLAWDSRSKSQNGQRWFHLQHDEPITTEHPFFWTRHLQNWNNRCADCHSTDVSKNYDQERHSYQTTFSEINVACEACHGPASDHVDLAESGALTHTQTGFQFENSKVIQWQFRPGNPIAVPSSSSLNEEVNMCAQCHSLRTPLLDKHNLKDSGFLDANRLQLINSPSYFNDGQIRDEVFVMGSFMQSKMYEKGVTCSNCHNPHTGKTVVEGNSLCAQCHDTREFDTPKHHRHVNNTRGAECVECHMPERTYMVVDNRRDHSFTTPRPKLSEALGVPNACVMCHVEKNNQWAQEKLEVWGMNVGGADHWAYSLNNAEQGNVLSTRDIVNLIEGSELSVLGRASLLSALASIPSRVSVKTALTQLQSSSPLLRRAAITSLNNLPAQTRWELLAPYLNDSSQAVRFQFAETLSDIFPQLPNNQKSDLRVLIEEYRQSLELSADSPSTQVNIANLNLKLGDVVNAEKALLHALRIEPNYVPALLNLADLYRSLDREREVEPLLKKAIKLAPQSGTAKHGYGLFLIRGREYAKALPYLQSATEQRDATPRFSYVYAVALDNQGKTQQAAQILSQANERWSNQFELLMLEIVYLEKIGRIEELLPLIGAISAIAPNNQSVKALVDRYVTKFQ